MIKKILIGIFLLTTTISYADCLCPLDRFLYVKLGGGLLHSTAGTSTGFGLRIQQDNSAIDLSVNWTGASKNRYYVTAPKMLYLQYFTDSNFYWGGGLGFGKIKDERKKSYRSNSYWDTESYHRRKKRSFTGLFAELALGYDIQRTSSFRTFVEATLSQGVVPTGNKNRFMPPALTLCLGVGF